MKWYSDTCKQVQGCGSTQPPCCNYADWRDTACLWSRLSSVSFTLVKGTRSAASPTQQSTTVAQRHTFAEYPAAAAAAAAAAAMSPPPPAVLCRYSSGRMQYVSVISQSSTAVPVSDPAPNALVFKPFTMDLLFDSRAADTF